MDVLAGPTFTIDSSPPPPLYDANRPQTDAGDRSLPSFGFFAGESSESSSSIGTPDDSEDETDAVSPKREQDGEDTEEVQSKLKGLVSLATLEDSLSIKRGLSNHFIGKSKSFTDLSKVSTVKELEKQENPLNKRRRILIASKWSRRSFYSVSNPKSMPLLPLTEDEDYEQEKTKTFSSSSPAEENKPQDQVLMREQNRVPNSYASHMRLRLRSFKSRSFSLADLQEHDEAEEGDDEDNDD